MSSIFEVKVDEKALSGGPMPIWLAGWSSGSGRPVVTEGMKRWSNGEGKADNTLNERARQPAPGLADVYSDASGRNGRSSSQI